MDIFLTRPFARWRAKARLSDDALCAAIDEMKRGLTDADLGAGLYKKRVRRPGAGKSGSYRTLIAARLGEQAIFLYGFAKNERDNIDAREERALKVIAGDLLRYDSTRIQRAIAIGELIELRCDDGEG